VTKPPPTGTTHPQVTVHTCYQVTCADCGDRCWEEYTPHYSSEADLWASVLGHDGDVGYEWTRRADGRVLCARCSERADCAERGHEWSEWREGYNDPEVEWRMCNHCPSGMEERLAVVPGGAV